MPAGQSQPRESQNVYDNDDAFWDRYSQFPRMRQGLDGASEWPLFRPMWPSPAGLRVLDLGCGDSILGCYAAAQGASRVLGVDLSQRMLDRAEENAARLVSAAARSGAPVARPTYGRQDLEDLQLGGESFDLVVSGLALHYVADFKTLAERVFAALADGGCFVFSVEHPMLTAPRLPGFLSHSDRALKLEHKLRQEQEQEQEQQQQQQQRRRSIPAQLSRSNNPSVASLASLRMPSRASSINGESTVSSTSASTTASSKVSSPASSLAPSRAPSPVHSLHGDSGDNNTAAQKDTFWPVESYFDEGDRHVPWLGTSVLKQHRTTATYFNLLVRAGFEVYDMAEWGATADTGRKHPDWPEGVVPRFLILGARKPAAAPAAASVV